MVSFCCFYSLINGSLCFVDIGRHDKSCKLSTTLQTYDFLIYYSLFSFTLQCQTFTIGLSFIETFL